MEIERKIQEALEPDYLDVINESYMHNVPAGSESHFKVVVVSEAFTDLNRIQRHQRLNSILAQELAGPVHALSIETLTSPEWAARGEKRMESPLCRGGGEKKS